MTNASEHLAALVLCALFVTVSTAHAQPKEDTVVEAQRAFEEGKRLARSGDYQKACPLFEKSQRLAPASGTLLNLANCYENLGRTATAWATFRASAAAARLSDNAEREREALARAETLEPRLAKLRIVVPAEARVDGLVIHRDDVLVDRSLWDVPVPVDPGRHLVKARAPQHVPFEQAVDVPGTAGVVDLSLERLKREPSAVEPPQPTPAPDGTPQRIIGLVIGGLGLAAVGVGIGFGVDALVKNDASNDAGCVDNLCPPDALDLREQAITEAHLSTGLMVTGLVNVAVGLIVFFTAPSGEERTSRLEISW
jgi:tetratricopeptide (TPR) repeat protein